MYYLFFFSGFMTFVLYSFLFNRYKLLSWQTRIYIAKGWQGGLDPFWKRTPSLKFLHPLKYPNTQTIFNLLINNNYNSFFFFYRQFCWILYLCIIAIPLLIEDCYCLKIILFHWHSSDRWFFVIIWYVTVLAIGSIWINKLWHIDIWSNRLRLIDCFVKTETRIIRDYVDFLNDCRRIAESLSKNLINQLIEK